VTSFRTHVATGRDGTLAQAFTDNGAAHGTCAAR
jgi:hypothetical protein